MAEKPGELKDRINASDSFDSGPAQMSSIKAVSDDDGSHADDREAGETGQIKAQIAETRSQMGETFDAIQERLSYENISEQVREQVSEQVMSAIGTAKETVYDATLEELRKAGEFMKKIGRDISHTEIGRMARRNPWPFVLIGLGVGLLAFQGTGGRRRRYRYERDREDFRREPTESFNDDRSKGMYESVSETASDAVAAVRSAADTAYRTVGDYAETAYEKVGEYGTQARDQYGQYVDEHPLAAGAVAVAVGAAIGFALPSTNYEGEYLGEYSRQVLDQAQSTAGDLIDRVREVAGDDTGIMDEKLHKPGLAA